MATTAAKYKGVIRWHDEESRCQDAGKYLCEINDATHWKNKGHCHAAKQTRGRQQKQQLQTSKFGARGESLGVMEGGKRKPPPGLHHPKTEWQVLW